MRLSARQTQMTFLNYFWCKLNTISWW